MTLLACQGVLFDCDGVLVDSAASVARAWARWARDLGLDPDEVCRTVVGRRSADTVARLVPPARQREELARIDRYELEDAATVGAVKGASELLASIPAGKWAVVTSGRTELALARLRAAGLPVPEVLVSADDVTLGKPDPEGYQAAARRLGLAPSSAVVLEDSRAGIEAARAAGARAIVGVGEQAAADGADVVVDDLSGVHWAGPGLLVD